MATYQGIRGTKKKRFPVHVRRLGGSQATAEAIKELKDKPTAVIVPGRGRRTIKKQLGFILLLVFLLLLLLEGAARLLSTVEQDWVQLIETRRIEALNAWRVYSPDLGWEMRAGYKGFVGPIYRELNPIEDIWTRARVAAVPQRKTVLFLGDSNMFGWGVPKADSFVAVLERLLPDITAVNLGVPGYSSYQGMVLVKKYLPLLRPDVMVVSFNYNDRKFDGGPDGPKRFRQLYEMYAGSSFQIRAALESVYIYRAMRRVMRFVGLVDRSEVRLDALKPRVDESQYFAYLTTIVELARAQRVRIIFLSLKDNPIRTYQLRRGVEELEQKNYDAAIAYLKVAVTENKPLASLYLAKAYAQIDSAQASRFLMVSRHEFDHYAPEIRLDTDYNQIMRRVARLHNVSVVDGGAALDKEPEVYVDLCHFNARGHRIVADLLAKQIVKESVERITPR